MTCSLGDTFSDKAKLNETSIPGKLSLSTVSLIGQLAKSEHPCERKNTNNSHKFPVDSMRPILDQPG